MAHLSKTFFIAATLLVCTCAVRSAKAAEPPADLCSLLPATDIGTSMGRPYDPPEKSLAPRPFPNTATGTDCHYPSKNSGGKLWFRVYVDPSPADATELFAKLSKFFGTATPLTGIGDEAYLDKQHALHVRKGKVRFYINLDVASFTPANEKQIKELGSKVAGRL
jgi:hypothetical protein